MKNPQPLTTLHLGLLGVLPALLLGVTIMILHGTAWSMPLMNLFAAFVAFVGIGLGSSALLSLISKRPIVMAIGVLVTMASTFLDAGLEGVHRWVRIGPIRLHPATIGTPLLLLAFVFLWERQRTALAIVTILVALALHVAQPDAGQATALAAAILMLAAIQDKRYGARFVLVILASLGVAIAWTRPDPLLGVPMVEDIVPRAFAIHPGIGIGAVLALAMLPGSALMYVRFSKTKSSGRMYGLLLAAYFAMSIVVVTIGEFPTPVLGFGTSPIWGAIVGLGLLARVGDVDTNDTNF